MIDIAFWTRSRWRRRRTRLRIRADLERLRLNPHMARDIGLPPAGHDDWGTR